MDYADEPYVRMYTRRTLTWHRLGWEGRAVRNAMLDGEFDAAGVFDLQGGDPAECICAVTGLPLEIVRVGLERLVSTRTWIVTAQAVTWPNYEEAQNCSRSNRLRQREFRRRRVESLRDGDRVTPESGERYERDTCVTPDEPQRYESNPPSPSSLPSTQRTSQRAPARRARPEPSRPSSPEPITEVRPLGSGGVARTHSIRGREAPQSYLDSALMAGVGREQALATWAHYATKGLPPDGVEDLEPWMVIQAKGFAQRRAKVAPRAAEAAPAVPKGRPAADVMREWEAAERAPLEHLRKGGSR